MLAYKWEMKNKAIKHPLAKYQKLVNGQRFA